MISKKDILDEIFESHQEQCDIISKEIYPIIEKQLNAIKYIRNYKIKPVSINKAKLTALNMCYIAYLMVLEGEY